jgi:hypothetical protein
MADALSAAGFADYVVDVDFKRGRITVLSRVTGAEMLSIRAVVLGLYDVCLASAGIRLKWLTLRNAVAVAVAASALDRTAEAADAGRDAGEAFYQVCRSTVYSTPLAPVEPDASFY